MGVGKTTIAKNLANALHLPHLDLDQKIEDKLQSTVSSIFEQKGEIFFRKQEHLLLHELIEADEAFVLSLGGGTPCYANNHEILQQEGVESFYLKASIKTLVEHLENKKAHRPLLNQNSDDTLETFIAKHLFDRSYFYHQAKHIISVDNKSISTIVDEIKQQLKN
ncbi:MAG: shikimate kinase [Flavobacteriaceae bacterium]|jgi:shikimate kinase|nr:shikimate kinase [Flavobacteriaceae bacterium]